MTSLKWAIVTFVAGAILGALVLGSIGRRQYASLRHYADSVGVASKVAAAGTRRYTDSLERVVTQLARRRTTIITRVVPDTGSNDPVVLKAVVHSLFDALALSDSMLHAERISKDSALVVIETLNRSITGMVTRIDRLQKLPTWAKVSLGTVALVGAAYGGFRVGQASRP